ncbi:MAG: TRAP transporter substrate-binding protein [Thermodesulfobacteriota bacterium]|nr:TRAP transporter substrate-binding protein [Thermodesulfobacteriota bacterium]
MKQNSISTIFMILLGVVLMLFISVDGNAEQEPSVEKVLKFSTFAPPALPIIKYVLEPWGKGLEQASQGRLKVQWFHAEALGKAKDQYDIVLNGVADIALICWGYVPGRWPLSMVSELPFAFPNATVGAEILWELYESHIHKEHPNVKMLSSCISASDDLILVKKKVNKLEDMRGLKVRGVGLQLEMIKAFGAVPLVIPIPDVYTGLQRGTMDAALLGGTDVMISKAWEVSKYVLQLGIGPTGLGIFMNKDTYNKLPSDLQKIVDEQGLVLQKSIGPGFDKFGAMGKGMCKKGGVEIYSLPPDEMNRWKKAVLPVWDKWVEDTEKRGLPGKAVMDDLVRILKDRGIEPF